MAKKVKPETEIRNLKKQVEDLRSLCQMAGIPPLIIYFPQLALKGAKISKADKAWAMQKIKEYKSMKKASA